MAYFFGASQLSDAFFAAFRLPNLFRTIFGEGALTAAFLPLYAAQRSQKGDTAANSLAAQILYLLLAGLLVLCALAYLIMPSLVAFLTPGYRQDPESLELIIGLSYILFPYIILASLMSFFGAILNSHRNFWVFASAPIILNLTMIASLFFGDDAIAKLNILCYGVLLGGALEVIWCYWFLRRLGVKFTPIAKHKEDLIAFFKRLGPAVMGSSVAQINIFLSTVLASFSVGGISYLYYADRIYQLPLALIGTAMGTVLLPTISSAVAENKRGLAANLIAKASELSCIIIMPIAALFIAMGGEIVELLFQRGQFGPDDVEFTRQALLFYAIALPGFVLSKIYYTVFFARGNTQLPFYASGISLVTNFATAILLHESLGFLSVALGAIVGTYTNNLVLYVTMIRHGVFSPTIPLIALKALIASIVCAVAAAFGKHFVGFQAWIELIAVTALGVVLYPLIMWLMGVNVVSSLFGFNQSAELLADDEAIRQAKPPV